MGSVPVPEFGRVWWFLFEGGVGLLDGRLEIFQDVVWKCGDDEGWRTEERAILIRRTCSEHVCDEEHDGVWAGRFHLWIHHVMGCVFGRKWHGG